MNILEGNKLVGWKEEEEWEIEVEIKRRTNPRNPRRQERNPRRQERNPRRQGRNPRSQKRKQTLHEEGKILIVALKNENWSKFSNLPF